MFILCDGMVRSGSTWSFNVALKLLRLGNPGRKSFGLYNENPAILASALKPRASHLVLKAHTLDPGNYSLCSAGKIKTIYTWRDPYDVVASCIRMFGRSTADWPEALRDALRIWAFHRSTNSACIVWYDSIVHRPEETIATIARNLDLPLEPRHLAQIAWEVSFENVKRFSRQVEKLDPGRVIRRDQMVFDRETLFHQGHICHGGTGYGRRDLEHALIESIDTVLRDEGFDFLLDSGRRKTLTSWALSPATLSYP